MSKLYSSRVIESVLIKNEFVFISQKGSHAKYKNSSGHIVIVPTGKKEIPLGTFYSILKQAGMNIDEFQKLL
jgi:predicted RNA binding protein YcfA (HicA-like mRNA interferase family)